MEFGLKITCCLLLATAAVTVQGASGAKPTKATGRGSDLPDSPFDNDGFGFNLEDALRPAVKPTEKPSGGDCQGNLVQKLGTVIEKQNQQLRLLAQLLAQSSSPRYNPRHMR
ncbi:Hypothetical protein SMAX5B_000906 [Scophthalmus maximus]|uniref:Uncharacterized protein n=1 Tax=Scophthalmus maximus TaxID=52904 RepID=A0A2U9AW37_SCOMX|nr:Hypothetical protein SMAX5B_000906 [Scophthalmus maximus]